MQVQATQAAEKFITEMSQAGWAIDSDLDVYSLVLEAADRFVFVCDLPSGAYCTGVFYKATSARVGYFDAKGPVYEGDDMVTAIGHALVNLV